MNTSISGAANTSQATVIMSVICRPRYTSITAVKPIAYLFRGMESFCAIVFFSRRLYHSSYIRKRVIRAQKIVQTILIATNSGRKVNELIAGAVVESTWGLIKSDHVACKMPRRFI